MPMFDDGERSIYYEDRGSGEAVLLLAPGGMRSSVAMWSNSPFNPVEELSDGFRVIAMDQRNAGQSRAPIAAEDGWHTYAADQLALMDHLGIERFHVLGMCIGGPFCLGLIESAPLRVLSAVLLQPIGLDDNREVFHDLFDGWAAEMEADGRGVAEDVLASFRSNLFDGEDFLFNVGDEFVAACATPLMVLQGNDPYHPLATSKRIRESAPNVTYIESWKEGADVPAAAGEVRTFLTAHSE
ncbi:MAG: alpha/beta hydrolase [Pseudomonadaceae bacterium]|nr:alpha/beta hydrolase [Pseudomonadaceae bacterium]